MPSQTKPTSAEHTNKCGNPLINTHCEFVGQLCVFEPQKSDVGEKVGEGLGLALGDDVLGLALGETLGEPVGENVGATVE